MWQPVKEFVARYERYLSGAFFLGGFILDVFTLHFLTLAYIAALLGTYVALAALAILIAHALIGERPGAGRVVSFGATLFPLVAQFFIGGALSGLVILYTMEASIAASWPFLALLAGAFISTEAFSKYRTRITFQTVLLFFTAYAYAVFALPMLIGQVNRLVFLGSGALTLVAFFGFLKLMRITGRERVLGKLRTSVFWSLGILAALHGAYFAGVIPPLPLALSEKGIYYDLSRQNGLYTLVGERTPLLPFRPHVVYSTPGMKLYAFSAVFAPARFSTHVQHRWEYFDDTKDAWVTRNTVDLVIAGGRDGGYRTYSVSGNTTPGKWRVAVTTPEGQVIGYIPFTVITGTPKDVITDQY